MALKHNGLLIENDKSNISSSSADWIVPLDAVFDRSWLVLYGDGLSQQ